INQCVERDSVLQQIPVIFKTDKRLTKRWKAENNLVEAEIKGINDRIKGLVIVILLGRKVLLWLHYIRVPLTRSAARHLVFLHHHGLRSEDEPH
ncbi:MAG: hypothetical protein JSV50_12060, partial [Desulfobacteraceae bacterium]